MDNWLRMAARFARRTRGSRDAKNAISRDLLAALDAVHMAIATVELQMVGLPPLRLAEAALDRL